MRGREREREREGEGEGEVEWGREGDEARDEVIFYTFSLEMHVLS